MALLLAIMSLFFGCNSPKKVERQYPYTFEVGSVYPAKNGLCTYWAQYHDRGMTILLPCWTGECLDAEQGDTITLLSHECGELKKKPVEDLSWSIVITTEGAIYGDSIRLRLDEYSKEGKKFRVRIVPTGYRQH